MYNRLLTRGQKRTGSSLDWGPHDGAKGERERSGRKARTCSPSSPGQSSVVPAAGCLPCPGRALCDALVSTQPVLSRAGRALPASPPVVRGLCVAAGGLHPRSPLCPWGGGFLHCCPVPPSPATQHLYPLSGSHCPSVGPFAPHPFADLALTASDLLPSPPAAWTSCFEEGLAKMQRGLAAASW